VKKYPCRIPIALVMTALASTSMGSAIEYKDPLDIAVSPSDEVAAAQRTDRLTLLVGDTYTYDDNIYRLPSGTTDLTGLPGIGRNPSRNDSIDTITGGLDGEWLTGARQSVDLSLRVDDNRFIRNTDLNNVSTNDRVAWNWDVGGVLSGMVGADYTRLLGGFVNVQVYSQDIINREDYFGSMRYQIGPRWGIFGGIMGTTYSVSSPQATYNNSTSRGGDVGADFTTQNNPKGLD
jgi:hypothetical protein